MKNYILMIASVLLSVQGHYAQISQEVKDEITKRVEEQINPSIALGVFKDGKSEFFVRGFRDLEKQLPADTTTLYEIGSITKTFTGLLLAKQTVEGSLTLQERVDRFLPDSVRLEDSNKKPIQLWHLSTHSSGLPRMPSNMKYSDPTNPYVDYAREDLFAFLANYSAENIEKEFAYSNLAVGLLGETLAIAASDDYKSLIHSKILEPLDLSMEFEMPVAKQSDFAIGYQANQAVSSWEFQALAGAGALRSTIQDLLTYGMAYLETDGPLSEALALSTKNYFTDQNGVGHGLGWFLKKGEEHIISHGGGTYGFRTYLAINLKDKQVFAIMTNSGASSAEDIVAHLINPEETPLKKTQDAIALSSEELQVYTGTFKDAQYGLSYFVRLEEGELQAQMVGQSALPLYYEGNDTFFYKGVDAKVQFTTNEDDKVVGLIIFQNGQEIKFTKQP